MGDMYDHREGELDNPDGFPRCPFCDEFVATDEKDIAFYFCGYCRRRFSIEEATD